MLGGRESVERGTQDSNLESPVLETGAFVQFGQCPHRDCNAESDGLGGDPSVLCDLLGVRWSMSNPRNVSISHRRSVAVLDEFVGEKT
jgi:hypothetical protein